MSEMGDSRRVVRSSLPPDFRFASKAAVERRAALGHHGKRPRRRNGRYRMTRSRSTTNRSRRLCSRELPHRRTGWGGTPRSMVKRPLVALVGSIVHNAPAKGIAGHGQSTSKPGRTQVGSNSGR